MIIRSQDKESIVNFNNVESLDMHKYKVDKYKAYADEENPNTFYIGYVGLSNSICWLGRYSTEEKAINVLDMIGRKYAEYKYGERYEDFVFQMPQDNEVTI